jgi:hypothetical protein
MDRFTRFKLLRALWAKARALLGWLHGPQQQYLRLRSQHWQQVQVAERQLMDGIVRGTEDPDTRVRPPAAAQPSTSAQAWQAHRDAQRQWYETQVRHGWQHRRR